MTEDEKQRLWENGQRYEAVVKELEALQVRHARLRKAAENFLEEYQSTTNVNLLDAYEMHLRAALAEEGK